MFTKMSFLFWPHNAHEQSCKKKTNAHICLCRWVSWGQDFIAVSLMCAEPVNNQRSISGLQWSSVWYWLQHPTAQDKQWHTTRVDFVALQKVTESDFYWNVKTLSHGCTPNLIKIKLIWNNASFHAVSRGYHCIGCAKQKNWLCPSGPCQVNILPV